MQGYFGVLTSEAIMVRKAALSMLLTVFAMPAWAVTVETASGDWSNLPKLSQRGYQHLNEKMEAKLFEVAESNRCPSFKLKEGRLDFSISFATQYGTDGSLSRVVLPRLDCAEAESVVGGALLEMLQAGDYAPTGKSSGGWYQGGLGFSFAGKSARDPAVAQASQPKLAANASDPNEEICEKVEEIGSRLSTKRVCMTRAQRAEQRRLNRLEIERAQVTRCQEQDNSC
jgi:hypothetical protein